MTNKRTVFWLAIILAFFLFLFLIRSILLPFVLGIFIAYFIHPAADRLQKAGLPRNAAALLIITTFFLALTVLALTIIPVVAEQCSMLIAALPDYLTQFEQRYKPALSRWLGDLPMTTTADVKSALANVSGSMATFAGEFVTGVLQSGMALLHVLSLILITPVVAFYLLRDWDGIVERINRLLPRAHADTIRTQLAIIDRTLAGFVRGQLNVCLIFAAWYALGLSILGLKFGIVIGLATGLLAIFPYVGLLLGMAAGLGVAFFQFDSNAQILAVLAVFLVGNAVENTLVTPRLVGAQVSLHPAWIIFGMLAGGALFGFVGVLLAVPATAVIGVLSRFAVARYLESPYYKGKP